MQWVRIWGFSCLRKNTYQVFCQMFEFSFFFFFFKIKIVITSREGIHFLHVSDINFWTSIFNTYLQIFFKSSPLLRFSKASQKTTIVHSHVKGQTRFVYMWKNICSTYAEKNICSTSGKGDIIHSERVLIGWHKKFCQPEFWLAKQFQKYRSKLKKMWHQVQNVTTEQMQHASSIFSY